MRKVYGIAGLTAAFLILTGVGATPARADDEIETLKQCVRLSTTGKDRITAARWLLVSLASAPQIKDLTTIDPVQKVQLDKDMAKLFTRLFTVDCLEEARPIFIEPGHSKDVEEVGGVLGEMAMQELLGNKDAVAAVSAYANYLDPKAFDVFRR